jgi:5'-nucleotidase (lipoprotein e(P4) family)
MHDAKKTNKERRRMLTCLLASGAVLPIGKSALANVHDEPGGEELHNSLLWAVAWKQTAAEYFALCHQAYNLARLRLDVIVAGRTPGSRRLAVITDMDDTILHAASYWGHLVEKNMDFFDDAVWDEWLPRNLETPVPGSLDFFNHCQDQDVEVFYITSRNQGERSDEYALEQLRLFAFPFADEAHLTVIRDSSNKSPAREAVAETHEIALLIGDNLNDFKRDYYVKDIDERMALMNRDRAEFGDRFILLPNPTNGHWVRAIFGDSEPRATDANRRVLKAAATRSAWDGL